MTLGGHIAAATCRLLVLIGALDEREAWAGVGLLGPAHWLSVHCGMGSGAAREHVRVARALRGLPKVLEAFAAGQISYSKVRAITRVATTQNQEDLLELADVAPANQLERLVRGLVQAQDLELTEQRRARRRVTWTWEEDGSLSFSGRLPPEDGARLVDVLQATADRAEDDTANAPNPEDGPMVGPAERRQASMADALVEIIDTAATTGDEAARWANARESVVHVALADLHDAPVHDAPVHDGADHKPLTPTADPSSVTSEVNSGPRLAHGPLLHRQVARRLACDGGIVLEVNERADAAGRPVGRTLEVGRRVRRPSAAQMRALWSRDGGCRYPGCRRRRHLHAHHVLFWSDGGPTELSNLVLICGKHHRLLHEGEYTLDLTADGAVTVRAPDGTPISEQPPPPGTLTGARAVATDAGATITPDNLEARWDGARLDLPYATSVIATNWSPRCAAPAPPTS